MRCRKLVQWKWVGKKSPKRKISKVISAPEGSEIPEGFEVCNGRIKSSISVDDDGNCSCCSYAYVAIEYRCEVCGAAYTPADGLPDVERLEQILDMHVYSLDNESHVRTIIEH